MACKFLNMTTTTISDFRANVRQYIDNVINDNGSLLINRGNNAAVLISLDEYNSIKATESILASAEVSQEIISGVQQWQSGDNIEVDIDLL